MNSSESSSDVSRAGLFKRYYFVDDRPLTLFRMIQIMQSKDLCVDTIFWYCSDTSFPTPDIIKHTIEQYQKINIRVVLINDYNFVDALDRIYASTESIFLFDFDLDPQFSDYLDFRINIQYALSKQNSDSEAFRIWLYSTAPHIIQSQLKELFPRHCLPVLSFDPFQNQIVLNVDAVLEFAHDQKL